ncbi:cytosine specific methyltransferase [Brochothrix phage BtpYZU03]|nr:cytosine specific methyltransferase [Brochothrix phage BtpYZU03]
MKFIDLFAGIGGIRLGMEQAGHECVAFCERDKFAVKSYKAIHNTEGEDFYDDITTVSDESWRRYKGTVDVVCGGFPCQAFSVAGKRKGFDDVRGTMFFYLANAVKQIEPRYFVFENVKGLLNQDSGRTFGTILNALDELGYDVEWHLYNSKDYGVPQNRERVYIVGHSRRYGRREILPFGRENGAVVSESPKIEQIGNLNETDSFRGNPQVGRVYNSCGLAPLLNTMQGGGREPKILIKEATKKGYAEASVGDSVNYSIPTSKTRRGRVGKGVANTLDTGCQQGVVVRDMRIRKLTPLECWRLQGFPDELFYKAQAVNSNSQLYKQAGNSVTVNVVYEVAKHLGGNGD